MFSFLRGRLRTKNEKRKKGEEANAVFVSFFGKQTRNMGLRRFPDFEVGFGLPEYEFTLSVAFCFHSFEVGFGRRNISKWAVLKKRVFIPSR